MSSRTPIPLAAILIAAALSACDSRPTTHGERPVRVFTSIAPQVYFVERIGGEHVTVEPFVEAGADPHSFSPAPRQMTRLAEADLFLAMGIEFEVSLLDKLRDAYPNLTIVACQTGVPTRDFGSGHEDHDHGPAETQPAETASDQDDQADAEDGAGGHHHHAGGDPHIWLDPLRAKRIARNIAAALQAADPAHDAVFLENLNALEHELDALHARLAEQLAPLKGRMVLVYHPAYGYFTDRYGLEQVPIEVDGRSPTARELERIFADARAAGVRRIFYEPQFDRSKADFVAQELGIASEPLDPLAPDYMKNLERIAARIVASWKEPS